MTGTGSAESGEARTTVVGEPRVDSADVYGPAESDHPSPWLEKGKIGRFTVLRELGRGGMGVVYAAYDDELDRRVALKLVLHRRGSHASSHLRLHREAQALAKLSHPNVVAVYEVGRHERFTFIAMEFVRGRTLLEYLQDDPSWSDRLDVLIQAGQGLAAAHAAGLTHRDFKPGNVLVGDDGRVRVADFGLARTSGADIDDDGDESDDLPADASRPSEDTQVTTAGTMMGTPAYMAPEQSAGGPLDARVDQYSFCVTVFEAFAGRRPPSAARRPAKSLSFEGVSIPGPVRRVVARGLELDPAARYPTMDALLTDLERHRRGSQRAWAVLAAAGVLAAGVFTLTRPEPQPCEGTDRPLREIWNDESRAAVQLAAGGSGLSYGNATATRVLALLDAQADAWARSRADACAATRIAGTQSEAVLDLRMACLDTALDDLRATAEVLSREDPAITARAHAIAGSLRPIERCDDTEALMAAVPPPEDQATRDAVQKLRSRLADGRALFAAGRFEEGVSMLRPLLDEAAELGYPPLVAEARYRLGRTVAKAGRFDEGRDELERAMFDAIAAGHDDVAIQSGMALVFLTGHQQNLIEDAERWWKVTEALVRRRGNQPGDVTQLATNYGSALKQAYRLEEAQAQFEKVLEIEEAESADTVSASVYNNLGNVSMARNETAEALRYFERAKEAYSSKLPEGHPAAGLIAVNIASAHGMAGDYEASDRSYREGLGVWERALGPDHPDLAAGRIDHARVLRALGRAEEGRAVLLKAITALRASGQHDRLARAMHAMADFMAPQQAVGQHKEALALREQALGSEHVLIAESLSFLVQTLRELGRHEEAKPFAKRALSIARAGFAPGEPRLADLEARLAPEEKE